MKVLKICVLGSFILGAILAFNLQKPAIAEDYSKAPAYQWDMSKEFFKKVSFVLNRNAEFGMSDKQIEEVKDLDRKTRKQLIKLEADLKTVDMDLANEMKKTKLYINAVKSLIDTKYNLHKERDLLFIDAFIRLEAVFTPEQADEVKSVFFK